MSVEIKTEPLHLTIYGFGSIAINKDYVGTAFKLSDKMWQTLKANNIKNKGQNIWLYEPNDGVFAGVELMETQTETTGLEQKQIILTNYAYYKHIGPYHLIKQAGQKMTDELKSNGYNTILPYIEIYGHWTKDENLLETELLMALG